MKIHFVLPNEAGTIILEWAGLSVPFSRIVKELIENLNNHYYYLSDPSIAFSKKDFHFKYKKTVYSYEKIAVLENTQNEVILYLVFARKHYDKYGMPEIIPIAKKIQTHLQFFKEKSITMPPEQGFLSLSPSIRNFVPF